MTPLDYDSFILCYVDISILHLSKLCLYPQPPSLPSSTLSPWSINWSLRSFYTTWKPAETWGVPFSFLLCSTVFLWFPMIIGAQTPLILAFSQPTWYSYFLDPFSMAEGTRQRLNPNPFQTGSFFQQEELSTSSLLWTSGSLLHIISWILSLYGLW